MKELKTCTIYMSDSSESLFVEVLKEPSVYTSYTLPAPKKYMYWGGEALGYPWKNGYRYVSSG